MAALMLGTSGLMAQTTAYTKPSGFVTHTLKAGQFNLVGLTLHEAVTVTGSFTTVAGTTLTDSNVDFTTTLTSGKTYILEVTDAADAALNGTIQEITVWSSNTLTATADFVAALAAGDKYQLRKVASLADIFGSANDKGLEGGASSAVADGVYIPTASGGFDIYYYSTGGFFGVGWRKVGGGSTDVAELPLVSTDGFYIFRQPTLADLDLVLTGTVKVIDTSLAITDQYTFASGVYPVGSTLDSSSLSTSLTGGASSAVADNVMIQNASGAFDIYYYSTGGFFGVGWRKVGEGNADQSTLVLPSAFIIRRVAEVDFNLKIAKPAGYENL